MLRSMVAPPIDPRHPADHPGPNRTDVAELTLIVPLKAGGAERLRAKLKDLGRRIASSPRSFGAIRDWRFVIFDNDTRVLLATTYDGEWDRLIDDVATSMWPVVDLLFAELEGYPGLNAPEFRAWIVEHQVNADAWYYRPPEVAGPGAVTEQRTRRSAENAPDDAPARSGRHLAIDRGRDARAHLVRREEAMVSTCRMQQISGSSPESWELAVQNALARVEGQFRNHWMAEILGLDVTIVNGKVAAYLARLNVCSWDEAGDE